jgi:hypothetical protein
MNRRKSKLIHKFSKLGIIQDSRPQATTNNPEHIVKKMYKSKNSSERIKFSKYMLN